MMTGSTELINCNLESCPTVDYVLSGRINIGSMFVLMSNSATESAKVIVPEESELTPYECCRLSGALSFWDNPKEDIYSFDDGQPL
ncbi:MAG: hypothetical protein KJ757_08260 [Planctomycetes bacterium]|nr:hypothetical protein [Planctomycetota bacterium]MBU1518374.1 hypothetical protein [Planctomycetota bacterium]MBU2457356.1 hypothetical protein [Planctomycetota bacterium]MBU2597535.1 hypothetical protein [Planctomycetota bacterium]